MAEFLTRVKCHKCTVSIEYWAELELFSQSRDDCDYISFLTDTRIIIVSPPGWGQYNSGDNEFCCPQCLSTMDDKELYYGYSIGKLKKKWK